jgi:hypothetical protein
MLLYSWPLSGEYHPANSRQHVDKARIKALRKSIIDLIQDESLCVIHAALDDVGHWLHWKTLGLFHDYSICEIVPLEKGPKPPFFTGNEGLSDPQVIPIPEEKSFNRAPDTPVSKTDNPSK